MKERLNESTGVDIKLEMISANNADYFLLPWNKCQAFVISKTTAQKMQLFIKEFLSKCDQIRRKLKICSHLLTKSFFKNNFLNFLYC